MKRFISLTIAILFASSYFTVLLPVNIAEAAEVNTSTSIVLDSTASQNLAYHMRYQWFTGYPRDNNGDGDTKDAGEADSWWPLRTEGCTSNTTTNYKIFPWLPENDDLNNASFSYDGNTLTTSGNCYDRYRDGGTSRGVWAPTYYGGGWVLDTFTPTSSWISSVATVSGDSIFSTKLTSKLVSTLSDIIWAKKTVETEEHSVALAKRAGYSAYTLQDGWGVYSSGSTLFRNEVVISQDQWNKLANSNSTAYLSAVADDWMTVYVNGVNIAQASTTSTITKITNHDLKVNGNLQSIFHVGKNVVAFQVSDKARWAKKAADVADSNQAGLNYKMTINLATETAILGCTNPADTTNYNEDATQDDGSCVIPKALSCSVSPQTGLSPLVVKVEANVTNPDPAVTYTYNYNMGDGTTLPDRSTPVYYTYSTAGDKTITVSSEIPGITACSVSVNVTDPTDDDGGEVNPTNP